MKPTLTLLLACIVLAGCKQHVYTDQDGYHYTLQDECVLSHPEMKTNYYPDGNGNLQPIITTEDVCDSLITRITYLDK